jgi:hypothetical protein
MKNKHAIRIISAATILTLSLTVNSFAAANSFTDLKDVVAKDKITALQEKGYIKGVGNNLFAPNEILTAAQGVQLIVSALELNLDNIRFIKAPKATDYFTKAEDSAWYADALIIASVKGLDLPKELDPNQKWTHEEFTYQLIKAIEKQHNLPMIKIAPVKITDEKQLEVSYSGAIQRAIVYGVVKLDSDGNFNPKGEITRAKAVEQIYDALEYLKTHTGSVITSDKAVTK